MTQKIRRIMRSMRCSNFANLRHLIAAYRWLIESLNYQKRARYTSSTASTARFAPEGFNGPDFR